MIRNGIEENRKQKCNRARCVPFMFPRPKGSLGDEVGSLQIVQPSHDGSQ